MRAGLLAGLNRAALVRSSPSVCKHAFDASTKMMATVHDCGDHYFFAIKGAPEAVLAASARVISDDGPIAIASDMRSEWLSRVEHLGDQGLRVLGCAMKTGLQVDAGPYEGVTFIGLVGLEDPARADVPHAVQKCREAGIRIVMVTCDHAVTARSIARAVGLGDATILEWKQVKGFLQDNNHELFKAGIFARVSPTERLELVRAYQATGEIVAMTGDGVNDAPALCQADISVAMGLRGTDVGRQAAAMILLDDAFPTIVKAIREGRVIFGNIRRFSAGLQLNRNPVIGLAVLAMLPLPILPLQILYLNLVTDVFPAFALAMGEGDHDIFKRPPRDPKEPKLLRVIGHELRYASSSL